jgi:hypothetical protein
MTRGLFVCRYPTLASMGVGSTTTSTIAAAKACAKRVAEFVHMCESMSRRCAGSVALAAQKLARIKTADVEMHVAPAPTLFCVYFLRSLGDFFISFSVIRP